MECLAFDLDQWSATPWMECHATVVSGVPGDVEGGDGGSEVVVMDPGVVVGTEQRQVRQFGLSPRRPNAGRGARRTTTVAARSRERCRPGL